MRKLLLKSLRDLLRMKLRVVSIWLLVSVVVFVYAGAFMARESLYHTRDTLCSRLRLSDLEVTFTPASPDEMPDLGDLEQQAVITRRLLTPGGMELPDGRTLASLIIYTDPSGHPPVNDVQILEGEYLSPGDETGVVIEKSLAEIHGYRVGDTLTINPTFPVEVEVRGIAVSPECLVTPANPLIFLPSKGSLGIVFASMKLVENAFGYPLYNNLSFLLRNPEDRHAFEAAIPDRLKGLEIERVTSKEEQFGYRFLSQDLKGFSIMIGPVVGIFCVITAIVIILTIHRLLVSQKKQIGVLMALGFTNGRIALSYLLMGVLFGIGGSAIGVAVSFRVNELYAGTYARIVGMPEVVYTTSWPHILAGALLGLALAVVSTAVPLLRLRTLSPQVVIREEPETVTRVFFRPLRGLERLVSRAGGTSLSQKIGLRNLFRRPRLALATILLIALAVSLSLTFQIAIGSMEHHAETQFQQEAWDAGIGFRSPLDLEDARQVMNLDGIREYELAVSGFGRLLFDSGYQDFRIVGRAPEDTMRTINLISGRLPADNHENTILYNNGLAERKLRLGERVTLETGRGTFEMEVAGLIEEYTFGQIYMPLGTAERVLGMEGKRTGGLATFSADPHRMEKKLFENELVSQVTLKVDLADIVLELLGTGKIILYVSLLISLAISLLFLFTAVTVNLLDRQREYATLQSIGLSDRSMIGSVLIEMGVEAAAALVLSVPISIALVTFLNHNFSALWPQIDTHLALKDFLTIMTPAVLVLPLSAVPAIRFLLRMDLPEVLRSRAFG